MKHLLMTLMMMFTAAASAQSLGSLRVEGERGKFQIFAKVKAVRCSLDTRGACDAAVFFDLNETKGVPAGSYLLGFENTIYPELVQVREGETRTITLEKLTVPSSVKGSKIRVYRDFASLVEQKKMYLTMFYMNRHFFRLDKENFGDLYLTGSWDRDFVQRFTYEVCPAIQAYGEVSAGARTVCRAWNSAAKPQDLRELFSFAEDGTFEEMWVTFPGDIIPTAHPKYMVSVPIGEADFVSVFPGSYRFQGDTAKGKPGKPVVVKAGRVLSEATSEFSLNSDYTLNSIDSTSDCRGALSWKTEERAYCRRDSQAGCDRSQARTCEVLQ
ncbi:hypothetical protein D3C87_1141030 [compost metagenome]